MKTQSFWNSANCKVYLESTEQAITWKDYIIKFQLTRTAVKIHVCMEKVGPLARLDFSAVSYEHAAKRAKTFLGHICVKM